MAVSLPPMNSSLFSSQRAVAIASRVFRCVYLVAFAACCASAAPTDDVYKFGPDSEPQPGVPQGKVTAWAKLPSEAYPGTVHDYCIYVPAQYDAR